VTFYVCDDMQKLSIQNILKMSYICYPLTGMYMCVKQ